MKTEDTASKKQGDVQRKTNLLEIKNVIPEMKILIESSVEEIFTKEKKRERVS